MLAAQLVLVLLAACGAAVTRGATATTWVKGKVSAGGRGLSIPSGVRVTLNQGERSTFVRKGGSFRFHDVVPGTYTLEVVHPDLVYPLYKLDVKLGGKTRAISYAYPGAARDMVPMPLVLQPAGRAAYFMERPKLNPLTMLKNPMVLMMGGMFIMMGVVMPRMMDAMTPEEREKMQSQMGSGNPADLFKNLMGGGDEPAAKKGGGGQRRVGPGSGGGGGGGGGGGKGKKGRR